MSKMKINYGDIFNKASSEAVANALSRISVNFVSNSFLVDTNPYVVGASKVVARAVNEEFRDNSSGFKDEGLIDSIAASAIFHLYDGWSYFSQAIKSSFCSNDSIARHLAYYGELRASLSILASHGVGVFNNAHVVVDCDERLYGITNEVGTHEIAWKALVKWGESSKAGVIIGQEVQAFGRSLSEWVNAFQGTSTPTLVGSDWVESWGVDLSEFTKDRVKRNEVSYAAQFNYERRRHTPRTIEPWLCELWLASEPGGGAFEYLDKYLIRSTLEKIYLTKFLDASHSAKESKEELNQRMRNACKELCVSEQVTRFFLREDSPEDLLVMTEAAKSSRVGDDFQYIEMMSRTYLLLRLATASVTSLLRAARLSADDLTFWWNKNSQISGLWRRDLDIGNTDELKELWGDTSVFLEDFRECILKNGPRSDCWFFFNSEFSQGLENLSRFEKVALWGIS